MRYRATRNYASWKLIIIEGEVMEIDEETAEWVNRDSPGTLVPAEQPGKRQQKPMRNRMVTSPQGDRRIR